MSLAAFLAKMNLLSTNKNFIPLNSKTKDLLLYFFSSSPTSIARGLKISYKAENKYVAFPCPHPEVEEDVPSIFHVLLVEQNSGKLSFAIKMPTHREICF